VEHVAVLWLSAGIGGLAAQRLRLPGGTLLGALAAAALVAAGNPRAALLPPLATLLTQALVGTLLGLTVDRSLLAGLPRQWRLIVATGVLTAAIWLVTALVTSATGLLEPRGALVGSVPAGAMAALLAERAGLPLGTLSLLLAMPP